MPKWIRVASLDDIPDGQVRAYQVGREYVALCRVGKRVYAVEDFCPHDTGPLGDGYLEDHQIVCPRHGARFDVRTGKVLCLPALSDIRSFPVKLDGDRVIVGFADDRASEIPGTE